ncbi:MAG: FAD-dependent oxidoreductase, partial [Flavobacteriaceae bacterium]|nr:FAD-dependent oxidoreductase [Flavobacteriaceae bacterium]
MSKEVIIVGGGIIGLCSAYYLQQSGHQVTIIDQSNMDAGASYVNAGYLSPSHIIPLSAPGVMKKGLRWMFNPSSPLYIKPRLDKNFLNWVWAFNKSCNPRHVQKAAPIIRDICLKSQDLYRDILKEEGFKSQYEEKGLMMICKTQKALDTEIRTAKLAGELDLETKVLDSKGIEAIEPDVKIDALGAVFYKCDHHTTPGEFMEELKQKLLENGVKILKNEKVLDLEISGEKVKKVITDKTTYGLDHLVSAKGAWTGEWNRKLGVNLLMEAGKGYRINSYKENGITIPAILAEAKAAVTPMHGFTRFAGTMEIAGINHKINKIRVEAIAKAIQNYYPEVVPTEEEKANAACGLRPVTPDGLPYIGNLSKYNNITVAAGHSMMGWSMATGTGL